MFCDVHAVVAEAQPIPVQSKAFPWGQGEHIPWGKIWLGTSNTGVISYPRRLGFLLG